MTLTVSKESKSKKRDTNMQQVQDTIESKAWIRCEFKVHTQLFSCIW